MGDVAAYLVFLGPLVLVPLGLVALWRAKGVVARAGAAGMLVVGAGWVFGLWSYFTCDEVPEPCGVSDAVETAVFVAMVAGLVAVVASALVLLVSRARRSRAAR